MNILEVREEIRNCNAFKERWIELMKLYNNDDLTYPCEFVWLGFSKMKIKNREELVGRIEELSDWLNYKIEREEI